MKSAFTNSEYKRSLKELITDKKLFFKIILSLWGLFVFLLPFIHSSKVIDPSLLPQLLFMQIILILSAPFILLLFVRNNICLNSRMIIVFFLCYLTFSIISTYHAINKHESMVEIQKLYTFFIFFLFIFFLYDHKYLYILAGLTTLTGMCLAFMALAQHFNILFQDIPGFGDLRATLSNKNMLASVLTLIIPFALLGTIKSKMPVKLFYIFALLPILFCLVISRIRSAVIAFILSIIISLSMFIFHKVFVFFQTRRQRLSWKTALVAVLIVIVCNLLFWGSGMPQKTYMTVLKCYHQSGFNRPSSANVRLSLWKITWRIVKENAPYGVGIGNWRIQFDRLGTSSTIASYGKVHFQRPHNDFLWILAETGFGGALSFLLLILTFFFYLAKIYLQYPDDRFVALCLAMVVISYIVDSLFSFPKERIANSMYFYLSLAIGTFLYNKNYLTLRAKSLKTTLAPRLITMAAFAVLLWCTHSCWQRILAETNIHQGIKFNHEKNWNKAVDHFTSAIKKGYQLDPFSASVYWYRGNANQQLKRYDAALQDFLIAYKQHPYNIVHLNDLGSCAAKMQNHELAITFYKKALELSPHFEISLANLAAEYVNSSRYEEAKGIYNQLVKDVPKEGEKYSNYLKLIEQLEHSTYH